MARADASYLLKRDYNSVDGEGAIVSCTESFSLKSLGKPPWELEIEDLWDGVIPKECTELVGAVIWRGERFVRGFGSRLKGRCWMSTSLSYTTDADVSKLREVYVNGVRFVRDRKADRDDVDAID